MFFGLSVLLSAAIFLLNGCFDLHSRANERPAPVLASTRAIAACVRNPRCYSYFVVAHRADGLGELENTRAAARAAIRHGIRFLEIDVQKSSDDFLYIFHDPTLERLTDGKGLFREKSSREIARLRLTNGETIPHLDEIYRLARGKVILVLDLYGDTQDLAPDWAIKNNALDDVIFFTDTQVEVDAALKRKATHPNLMMLVDANSFEDVLNLKKQYGRFPEIVQTSFMPTLDQVKLLHSQGSKIYASIAFEDPFISRLTCALVPIFKRALKVDFLESDRPLCCL